MNDSGSTDVNKLIRQQLLALARAGVTELPAAEGKFEFSFTESEVEPAGESVAEPERRTELAAPKLATQDSGSTTAAKLSGDASLATLAGSVAESRTAAPSDSSAPARSPGTVVKTRINVSEPYGEIVAADRRADSLAILNQEVQGCQSCQELCSNRTQTVFGVGNPSARLVFVGEGPGADEDRTGIPFVGKAGQLLDKILGASKIKREEVYILNTVKCRPPGNRNPTEDELANCWSFAERQLEILQPEFICCLGSVASKTLLGTTQSLGRLRQQFHQYRSSRVMVTYHPAYLLRNEGAKVHVWNDMKMLMKEMGVDLSTSN